MVANFQLCQRNPTKRAVKSELPDKKCGVVEMRAERAPAGLPGGPGWCGCNNRCVIGRRTEAPSVGLCVYLRPWTDSSDALAPFSDLCRPTTWYYVRAYQIHANKVAHARLPSLGFRSWSRCLAVSLQVTWVINPTVSCHYFPPGPQLPPQPLRGLLPILLLGEQRHNGSINQSIIV